MGKEWCREEELIINTKFMLNSVEAVLLDKHTWLPTEVAHC